MSGMTIEKFGDIIDEYLTSNEVQMLLTLPKGTLDVQVQENTGGGPVMQFYILLNTIKPIAAGMRKLLDIDGTSKDWAKTVDGLLELVRDELVEGES